MELNQIKDNEGARKGKIRVGRGIGCGKGKTCGRGVKGQTSRTGVRINGFEGGQMPIHRRLPKRGFNNFSRMVYEVINLGDVQKFIDSGKLDAKTPITSELLVQTGVIRKAGNGIKLLAKGALTAKVTLEVAKASEAAVAAVEKAGGKVVLPAA